MMTPPAGRRRGTSKPTRRTSSTAAGPDSDAQARPRLTLTVRLRRGGPGLAEPPGYRLSRRLHPGSLSLAEPAPGTDSWRAGPAAGAASGGTCASESRAARAGAAATRNHRRMWLRLQLNYSSSKQNHVEFGPHL